MFMHLKSHHPDKYNLVVDPNKKPERKKEMPAINMRYCLFFRLLHVPCFVKYCSSSLMQNECKIVTPDKNNHHRITTI